ncbi:MAG: hypothetical protein Crog4KO_34310 [Crocinitomicaceae bacterium]
MKKLFILPALALSLFACNVADDADYKALAKDACDCVNKSTDQLSPEMMQVIVDSEGDETKLQELMAAYASENPMQAMQDAQAMQGSMVTDITTCMEGLEKKYDDVYSTDSEAEIQKKILDELKAMDDCKSSYAFMKMGMGAQ